MAEVVAAQFKASTGQIHPETSFVKDLGADSLDCVELVMELEEEFDISISDVEAVKLQTVGQAIACVKRLQEQKSKS